jgi:hypothetical protein
LAERNLRHFLEYFQEGEITYEIHHQIKDLVDQAVENQIPEIFIQRAD